MVTASSPIYDASGKFIGVATADIDSDDTLRQKSY